MITWLHNWCRATLSPSGDIDVVLVLLPLRFCCVAYLLCCPHGWEHALQYPIDVFLSNFYTKLTSVRVRKGLLLFLLVLIIIVLFFRLFFLNFFFCFFLCCIYWSSQNSFWAHSALILTSGTLQIRRSAFILCMSVHVVRYVFQPLV